jgi:signal transduction histidine kinase
MGLEVTPPDGGFSLAIGEGFAGTIAQTQKPLILRSASTDPLLKNPAIRNKGVKALYGVPLIHEIRGVIGVAHMGSITAHEFAAEDMELFSSMASRAALAIEYHLAKDAVAEAVRVRDDVLAIVSHDLRNPLGSVLVAADLLSRTLRTERNEVALKALGTIHRSATRMTRLVEDLLDYGSLESGRLGLTLKSEVVADIVSDVVDAHSPMAGERGIRLERSVDEELPLIECDRERILQVFGNLIGNALKGSPTNTTITIGAESTEHGVRLSVSDEGVGIAPAEIDHVFERFWRSGRTQTDHGRGLGLFIVKGIVEAHGGTVEVRSAVGKGSTFSFELPAQAQHHRTTVFESTRRA